MIQNIGGHLPTSNDSWEDSNPIHDNPLDPHLEPCGPADPGGLLSGIDHQPDPISNHPPPAPFDRHVAHLEPGMLNVKV